MTESTKTIREVWAIAEKRQFCKQSCTKISQGLDKLDPRSGERAIWELFQNARDLAKKDDSGRKVAHIKMIVTPTEFIFAHQGKPFTHDSFGSLVKQVSSQEKEDEESVGQYGTGFLTTHAFGRKILVTGSLDMEEQAPGKYVNIDSFEIDRTFDDIPEFVDKMARQLVAIENYADAPQVDECRDWTEFHYQLSSAEGALEKVLRGLKAAIEVMPYVLTINEPIADVTIIDEVNGKTYEFKKEPQPSEEDLYVMGIRLTEDGTASWQKVYYLQSADGLNTVIMPLRDAHTAKSLTGIAKLFVYFPLLGTENFGMDFLFHSHRFYPVEERDAIHLPVENPNVRKKYEANEKVLSDMSEMVFDYLREHCDNISGLVNILSLSFECLKNKEDMTNEYFESFKKEWVSFYETLNVIPVGEEMQSLNSGDVEVFTPTVVESFENKHSKWFDDVYEALAHVANLPHKDVVLSWSKVVRSWKDPSSQCFMSVLDMAKMVSEQPCAMDLLHSLDTYIREMSGTTLFDEYPLIPNRNSSLKRLNELEDGDSIPNWLSDMLYPLVDEVKEGLVRLDFADVVSLRKFTRKDLCGKITEALGHLRDAHLKHEECYDADMLKTLANICSIYKQLGLNIYRNNAMPIICNHLGLNYEEQELSPLDSDERDIAQLPFKHLVENMLLEISLQDKDWIEANYDYVLSLHQSLSGWTEYYDKNNKKGLAVSYGAFPNKLNQPCKVEDLQYGCEIPDVLVELYQSVMDTNLCETLVSEDFKDFYEFETLTAEEVAADIEAQLEDDGFKSDFVLDIINNLDDDKWQRWFPRITEKKAELFMKQVKPECKDSVFRLMKVNDPSKLTQLADLAEEVDLDEIIRHGKAALQEKWNREADFEYKKQLGEYVEDCVQAKLSDELSQHLKDITAKKVKIVNEQFGHDLVVCLNNKPVYFIEVKSRWSTDQSVMMSPLQMRTSVDEAGRYALCCADMTGMGRDIERHDYPNVESSTHRIKCITNIGELNSTLIDSVDINAENSTHIGGDYKCIVPQKVIQDNGKSLEDLVSTIVEVILATSEY